MAGIKNEILIAMQEAELIRAGLMSAEEELHTFQRWKALGYSVKKGEHAVAKFPIWKMGTKKDDDGEEVAPSSDYHTDEHSAIDRPMYCEQCRLYPRKCDGADCYYDYLEALTAEHK